MSSPFLRDERKDMLRMLLPKPKVKELKMPIKYMSLAKFVTGFSLKSGAPILK